MKCPMSYVLATLVVALHSCGECQKLNSWSVFTNIFVANPENISEARQQDPGDVVKLDYDAVLDEGGALNAEDILMILEKPDYDAVLDEGGAVNAEDIVMILEKPDYDAVLDEGGAVNAEDIVMILEKPDYDAVLDEGGAVNAEDIVMIVDEPDYDAVLGMTLDTMDHVDQLFHRLTETMNEVANEGQLLIGTALPRVALPVQGHNNTQCLADTLRVKDAASNLSTWALKMLDATANPSGRYISLSDVYNLGNYDECLSVREEDPTLNSFVGQQCLVAIRRATNSTNGTLQDDVKSVVGLLENRTLYWAMCMPSSCTASDLQRHLETLLPEFSEVSVKERDCYTATDTRHWDIADVVMFALLGFTVVLVVLSSFCDYVTNKYRKTIREMPVATAFSLRKNLKALFSRKVTSVSIKSLHGIKFLSVVWVVVGRRYRTDWRLPTLNHDHMVAELHQHSGSTSFLGSNLSVDTFILVSGTLLAYGFFKDRQAKRTFNIFVYYVYRYLRMTPVYGVVIGLYSTLLYDFGSGPFWNAAVGTSKDFCRENWWTNLLYVNNYVHPDRQCVEDSWFLSVIMQLFWIAPGILYPLWKWPVFGKTVLSMTFLLSVVVPLSLTVPWSGTDMVNTFDLPLYQATFTRSSPYFIGIGLGFVLHSIHKEKDTPYALSRWMVLLGWVLSTIIVLTVLYFVGGNVRPENEVYLTTLPGVGWSLSTAWFIFACENGYAGVVRKVLSWKLFKPLSRLSFCVFLVHGILLQYDSGSTKILQYFSYYGELHRILGDLLLVFLLAGVFYLAFEKPLINLNRAIFKPELLHRNLQVTEACLQYLSNSNFCFEKSDKIAVNSNMYGTVGTADVATIAVEEKH